MAVISFTLMAIFIAPTVFQSGLAFYDWCMLKSEGKAPIATSGNNVYVTWWGNKTGNYEVMFKGSNDGGKTFGQKINLSNSPNGTSAEADVAAAGNNAYVTYWDNKTGIAGAYLRVSTDGGKTFQPEVKLTDPAYLTGTSLPPGWYKDIAKKPNPEIKVAAQGNNVYVVATGDETKNKASPPDVFIKTSSDNGKTFGEDINLSQSKGISSERVQVAAQGNNVYVTWWDKSPGVDQPLMKISNDNGKTFGDLIKLTANSSSTTL